MQITLNFPQPNSLKSGIYLIRNLQTKKFYLGSTVNFAHRWAQHRQLLRSGRHHSRRLQASWSKYGEKNFEFFVIGYYQKDSLITEEQWYLSNWKCHYNGSRVAGRVEHSVEVRDRLSVATRARYIVRDDKTLREICDDAGVSHSTIYGRMKDTGCTLDDALQHKGNPAKHQSNSRIYEYKGGMYNLRELAEFAGVSKTTVFRRLLAGMSVEATVELTRAESEALRRKKIKEAMLIPLLS